MNRNVLVLLAVVLLLCICLVLGSTGILVWQMPVISQMLNSVSPTFVAASTLAPALASPVAPTLVPSRAAPSMQTLPPATPLASVSNTTADALLRTQIPERDLYQIVPRLRKNPALATPQPTLTPRALKVGDVDTFFVVQNASTGTYRTVTATLQVAGTNGLFWVENGMQFDAAALKASADYFDKSVFPTDVKYFGDPLTGLDGEKRIHILNTRFQDAAGYFSSEDSYPRTLVPYSNQRHIIYMNIEAVQLGGDEYNGDLGHEFQHLIHNVEAQHETGWIDEGMGDLAIKVNGFSVGGVLNLFSRNPDTQLNTWANDPQASLAHYAASYLFFDYTALRFGPDFIRAVIHAPGEGVNGVQAVLDQRANGLRFEDLFADWSVANLINDPSIENVKYGYTNESNFRVAPVPTISQVPTTSTKQMREYSSNYYSLQPTNGDVTVSFTGTTTAKLIAANAHTGKWMWYSNRADLADMTLTRAFDLTRVSQKATLQFWMWYDIEQNFDYAYVEVSMDGGKTWDILPGRNTTTTNPNGASYGPAFTGRSGVSDNNSPAQWVQEQMDLSAYAGKNILLRFEYITDDAYNAPSWAIDDIAIPEINYSDGAENGDGGWQAQGFIRADNVLPQKYIVQVVEMGAQTRVVRIPLDAENRGNLTIAGFGKDITKATIVVNAFALTTTEQTEYQIGITK